MELISQSDAKRLTRDDFRFIFEGTKLKTEPMVHQYASMLWSLYRDRVIFFHAIGTGKTLAALYTNLLWKVKRTLVVCPCSVVKTWIDEIEKHTDLGHTVLTGPAEERRAMMEESKSPIHIVNYEGLKLVYGKRVPRKPAQHQDPDERMPTRWVADKELIERCSYDSLVFDECHHLKNWDSIQTTIAHFLARQVQKIILLTGTPMARDIRDFWAELMVLDNGATLGPNLFEFLHTYMNRVQFKVKNRHFYEWFPKKGSMETIVEKVAPVAIRYDTEECADLPEVIYERRYIEVTAEQRKLINVVMAGLKEDLKQLKLDRSKLLNKAAKLAQIASGFMLLDNDQEMFLKSNPKMDELVGLLLIEIPGKCIVFHNFVAVGRMIEQALKKHNLKFRSLRGEIKNKLEQIDDFQKDPSVKVLVANSQSGGEGLNLQVANVIIYFDQIWSPIARSQCDGRVVRTGQKQHCLIIDLLQSLSSKTQSIDERIHNSCRDKQDICENVLQYIRDYDD